MLPCDKLCNKYHRAFKYFYCCLHIYKNKLLVLVFVHIAFVKYSGEATLAPGQKFQQK